MITGYEKYKMNAYNRKSISKGYAKDIEHVIEKV